MVFKVPTSKAEMDELRKSLKQEIGDDMLDSITGGHNTEQGKEHQGQYWTCPFCSIKIQIKSDHDPAKHLAHDCTMNPFK